MKTNRGLLTVSHKTQILRQLALNLMQQCCLTFLPTCIEILYFHQNIPAWNIQTTAPSSTLLGTLALM